MSDILGGHDYGQTRMRFLLNDFVSMPFSATVDYYLTGIMAFLSNPQVFDVSKGWSLHNHNQPGAPLFFGFLPLPSPAPSFESKRLVFRPTQRCTVRFGDIRNVAHELPANQASEFFQRSYILFIAAVATAGTLRLSVEG